MGKEWLPVIVFLASQAVLMIWALATVKQQVTAMEAAVRELREAVKALVDFQSRAEHRITRIEERCLIHHSPTE
jgi:plasmid stabilization system protein ParE